MKKELGPEQDHTYCPTAESAQEGPREVQGSTWPQNAPEPLFNVSSPGAGRTASWNQKELHFSKTQKLHFNLLGRNS